MELFISTLLMIFASLLALVVAVFFVEVIAAVVVPQRAADTASKSTIRPRLAVLVPAHNESTALIPTLKDIQKQACADDRVLVVADNCSDDTAKIAAATGAEVVERIDPSRRGKGYALDFGLRHLAADPPEVIVVFDADCRLADNSIHELIVTCAERNVPVQALDLMIAPTSSQVNQLVAEFAWRVKNWLRPQGLRALGLPCQLMGTGMAFPWDLLHSVDLANGALVEDLHLGLDLATNGHAPLFCPSARVISEFPSGAEATANQRERWEHGHIRLISTTVPRLLGHGIIRGDVNLLALALDIAVPPLSLLAMLVTGTFALAVIFAVLGFATPALIVSATTLVAFLLSAGLAWLKCGRDIVPARAILSIPFYALGKLGLYRSIFSGIGETHWKRTDRDHSEQR